MKKLNVEVIIVGLLITCGILGHGMITAASLPNANDGSLVGENVHSRKEVISDGVINLTQAASYLDLEETELKAIILIEENKLEQIGRFSGLMCPYFKVNDEFYFTKVSLDQWLQEVLMDNRVYNTKAMTLIQ